MKQPISALLEILEVVIDHVSYLRSGKETKRTRFIEALTLPRDKLNPVLADIKSNVYKSYPNILELRDSVKKSVTVCLSLSELIASGKIKVRPALERIAEVETSLRADMALCVDMIDYLQDNPEEESDTDMRAVRRDQRETAATAKTAKTLDRMKARYKDKVPKNFENTQIKFVQLPVMARFGTMSMNPESLTRMGFKIEAAGLHSTPSSDLGIIFEHQTLLFFRLSDARQVAEEAVELQKSTDGVMVKRGALMKRRSAAKRAIKKLEQQAEGLSPRRRLPLDKQIAEQNTIIDAVNRELDSMIDNVKQSQSVGRVLRQMKVSNDHAILNYLNPIIDVVNQKSSTDYALFTTMPARGVMKDSDVVAAWLMPKSAVQLILRHTHGDTKLQSWMLPW